MKITDIQRNRKAGYNLKRIVTMLDEAERRNLEALDTCQDERERDYLLQVKRFNEQLRDILISCK